MKALNEFLNEESLQDKLSKKRALTHFDKLKFKDKIKGKQKDTLLKFLDTHWNFELEGDVVTAIGGKSYDKEKVIIQPNGEYHKISI